MDWTQRSAAELAAVVRQELRAAIRADQIGARLCNSSGSGERVRATAWFYHSGRCQIRAEQALGELADRVATSDALSELRALAGG